VNLAEFIAKLHASMRNERAACQEHFFDLWHLLDELARSGGGIRRTPKTAALAWARCAGRCAFPE